MKEPWWIALIEAGVIVNVVLVMFAYLTLIERKMMGRMQLRYGPNRAGPFGLLQPIADLVKLVRKEAFSPSSAIELPYIMAPIISAFTAIAAFAVIPWGPGWTVHGWRINGEVANVSIGLLLIFMVGPATPIGAALSHLNLTASDTFFALVLAEVYEAVPYYVLGAEAAFAAVEPDLEQAAALLGDGRWRTWRQVTLPLAAPGLAMALAVTWARAMGAFGAVLIIAYHPFGLPMQIWTTLQESGLSSALPFALVLLVVALPVPVGAYIWSSRARRRF